MKIEFLHIGERLYRITGIETVCFGIGGEFKILKADFFYGGEWHEVKNIQIMKNLYNEFGAELERRINGGTAD